MDFSTFLTPEAAALAAVLTAVLTTLRHAAGRAFPGTTEGPRLDLAFILATVAAVAAASRLGMVPDVTFGQAVLAALAAAAAATGTHAAVKAAKAKAAKGRAQ